VVATTGCLKQPGHWPAKVKKGAAIVLPVITPNDDGFNKVIIKDLTIF